MKSSLTGTPWESVGGVVGPVHRLVSLPLELAVVGPGPDQGGRVEHSPRPAVYAQRGSAHGGRQTDS